MFTFDVRHLQPSTVLMETIKQKIEGHSTKDTEVAPVVQIVTEEEYIELFATESNDEIFDGA